MKMTPQSSIYFLRKLFFSLFLIISTLTTVAQDNNKLTAYFLSPSKQMTFDSIIVQHKKSDINQFLKSTQTSTIRLDSTITEQPSYYSLAPKYEKIKVIYIYIDEIRKNHQTIKYTSETIDGEWDNHSKTDYEYREDFDKQTIYRWDKSSGEWKDSLKEEFVYQNQKLITDTKFVWDKSLNDWRGSLKREQIYNEKQQLTNAMFFNWDKTDNTWVNNSNNEYGYDENGFINSHNLYLYSDGTPFLNKKEEYVNDSIGIKIQTIIYKPHIITREWNYYLKHTISYDKNYNITEDKTYDWDTMLNEWILRGYNIFTFEYNDANKVILSIGEHYNSNSQNLRKDKTEYFYNENNRDTLKLVYNMIDSTDSWKQVRKEKRELNNNGNIVMHAYYDWDDIKNDWLCNFRQEYYYPDNDVINYYSILFAWDYNTNTLEKFNKIVYHSIGYDHLLLPLIDSRITYLWNKELGVWELDGQYFAYYSEHIIDNIDAAIISEIRAFPNPTNEALYFNLNQDYNTEITIEIFDMNGKKMYSGTLEQNSVSTAGFENGMYFYHLTTGEKSITGKFIVQH